MPFFHRVCFSPDITGAGSAASGDQVASDANQPAGPAAQAQAQQNINSLGVAPGTTGDNSPTTGQLPGTAGKMVGAGLEPGSTDFGSSTAPMVGGTTGAGHSSSRSVASGVGSGGAAAEGGSAGPVGTGFGGSAPASGAAGNSVTATGRPMRADVRDTIGRAATSTPGGTSPENPDAPAAFQPGQSTREAAGPIGSMNRSPGTAGKGTADTRDRTLDALEGRADPTAGTLPGGDQRGLQSAANDVPHTQNELSHGHPTNPAPNKGQGT